MRKRPAKIVVAPDSFKESLSAAQVAGAIVLGLREVWPGAEYIVIPMADGGEGTVTAVTAAVGGSIHMARVTGPMGEGVAAQFGMMGGAGPGERVAVLEMAAASGLELVPLGERDPLRATSYGTGELLRAALDAGATRCVMGIGGSATVDGGAGMLQALGAKLLDAAGEQVRPGGGGLVDIASIDLSGLDRRLGGCPIDVACDVDSPLLGARGAAAVFGPQKGATEGMVAELEKGLANFAAVMERDLGIGVADVAGAGAAGGAGAALMGCLRARLQPGAALIAELVGLEEAVRGADLVFTGEGRIDGQTIHGKTPIGVAGVARRHGRPVIALAGSIGPGWEEVLAHGMTAVFAITPRPCTRDEAFAGTAANLRACARNIAATWSAAADF